MDLNDITFFKLCSGKSENHRKIVDAISALSKKYSNETPEMWCSRIRTPFRRILEENSPILSKNGYIIMYGMVYGSDKKNYLNPSNYIYCSICDSLVFIARETCFNKINCDSHLKNCKEISMLKNHIKTGEMLQAIDKREYHIWKYKQYILREEAEIERIRLELFSQKYSHSEKDKIASVKYDIHDKLISYETYKWIKDSIGKKV